MYDGYLVIQERDQDNVPTVTYTRGLDLSGTCCDALGGIGGLLARTDNSALIAEAAEPHAYYHADGSGNVTMLVDSLDRPVAQYLYDPYGNTVGQSGQLAEANVYRFSSKAYDARSGLYNFGRRFYAPSLQRWMSRDPIGIEGGVNLYVYTGNRPLNALDRWGTEPEWYPDYNPMRPDNGPYDLEPVVAGWCEGMESSAPFVTVLRPELGLALSLACSWMGEVQAGRDAGFTYSVVEGEEEPTDLAQERELKQMVLEYVSARVGIPIFRQVYASVSNGAKVTTIVQKVKKVTRAWQLHHAWPKYLQGPIDQTLARMPSKLHGQFHRDLDRWKNRMYDRRKGADYFADQDPSKIINDLRDFYTDFGNGKYRAYLPYFDDAVKKALELQP